jgi:CBS domain-containing protein
MLIRELMKRPFVIEKDVSLAEAAKVMSEKNIGSLLFMSGAKIKGILTERDLLRNFGKSEKVSQAMTTKVITITSDEPLDRAMEEMREHEIKRLPVVDAGKLVGIITLTDLAANFEAVEEDFFFE